MAASTAPAIVAVCLSAAAFAFTLWNTVTARHQARVADKRDRFLTMHEKMVDEDLQRGRARAYDLKSVDEAVELMQNQADRYAQVNRAMAMFDILALAIENEYLDAELAMSEWRVQFRKMNISGQYLIDAHERVHGNRPWPHLAAVAKKVAEG